jgi:hypothetical protein
MNVDLTFQHFFEAREGTRRIESLLGTCLSGGLALEIELTAEGATATALPDRSGEGQAISLSGRWRSRLLASSHTDPGALLLAPFLFSINRFRFAPRSLYTLGRGTRSVADFCMRNYLFAAIRGEAIQLTSDDSGADTRATRELARTYLWMAKEYLKEDLLKGPNAPELMLANAHVSISKLSDPLLKAGVAQFQKAAAQAYGSTDLKPALLQARQRIMGFYEA